MHRDYLGDELEIGDVVLMVFSGRSSADFKLGMVVGNTPQNVRVLYKRWSSSLSNVAKHPSSVIKHPKIPKQDLSNVPKDKYEEYFKEVLCNK